MGDVVRRTVAGWRRRNIFWPGWFAIALLLGLAGIKAYMVVLAVNPLPTADKGRDDFATQAKPQVYFQTPGAGNAAP